MMNEDDFMEALIEEYQETLEAAAYAAERVSHSFKWRNEDGVLPRIYRRQLKDFEHFVFLLYLESEKLSEFLSAQDEKYDE